MKNILLSIEITEAGFPAFWEAGGLLFENGPGAATIVTGREGQKKKPIFVNNKGKARDRKHALFVLKEGDCVVLHYHGYFNESFSFLKIYRFKQKAGPDENKSEAGHPQGIFEIVYDSSFPGTLFAGAVGFLGGRKVQTLPTKFEEAAEIVMRKSYTEVYDKPLYYEPMTRTKEE